MFQYLYESIFVGLWVFALMACLAQGNLPGGLLALLFIVGLLYAIKNGSEEEEYIRKQQEEARLKAEELARQERARREWEQTPAGRAHLEQQAQLEEARRQREAEEVERRRRESMEQAARANWCNFHESKTMLEISGMTGLEFERFLARLLTKIGYRDIQVTPINDQGGDLVGISPQGLRTVVQAKRWKNALGISVVQELLGAMLHYDCLQGLVITNSTFTSAARN